MSDYEDYADDDLYDDYFYIEDSYDICVSSTQTYLISIQLFLC